jgi:hypothetical protein
LSNRNNVADQSHRAYGAYLSNRTNIAYQPHLSIGSNVANLPDWTNRSLITFWSLISVDA